MTEPALFRWIVTAVTIWKGVGWGAILYFATLSNIDTELYEAAYIDGANRIKQTIHVTLPGSSSIIVLMLLLTVASMFSIDFDRIYLIQNPLVYQVSDVISTYYYLITMYFGGGLIPTYILIANWLNLSNNLFALILPVITNVFYIIVFRNAIAQLPKDIMDSAEIDGASNFTVLFKIVLPLMLPMVMAFVIFSAVAYWNEWFGSMLYIRDNRNWTLQYRLRNLLVNTELADDPNNPARIKTVLPVHPQNLRMAALMVTILPIIIIYPFLQRYFIHGVIVGAVKG